ncbi:MAG: hypothetical protein E6J69_03920 [Deltaproteobacteria bacterium]|nr:MAG: hypothetical protein E6J69_03920 [Deltaproteobacteria bacterium]
MRPRTTTVWLLAAAVAAWLASPGQTRAADEAAAPPDPTRGQWDSFLDPLRDFEDNAITGTQKRVEDATKIHLTAGLTEAYTWDFNKPRSGSLIALHSLEHHNDGVPVIGQLGAFRPSEGWFIPGLGLKLDAGKVARDVKADWNGNGGVKHGDTFETTDFDVQEAYLTWTMPDDGPSFLKGLSVKGGKFVTLLGAEVIEPWSNYNYSRSFLFSFAIPFTHTGALVSYPISDKLSVTGGAIEGWDKVQSNNQGWTGIGNVTYTVSDQLTLAGNGIWGPEQTNKTGNKRGVADFVATIKPTSALTLLLNYDWGQDHGGARTGLGGTFYEGTVTGKYLFTQHLYGQVEYRHDESGKGDAFPKDSPGKVNGSTGPIPIAKFTDGQDILGFAVTYVFN